MHTAVIPAAGLGTRFLPATKAVPKELMPIFDTPALQLVMDEAIGAGCDHIVVVWKMHDAGGKHVVGLKQVPMSEVSAYGCVKATGAPDKDGVVTVTGVVEKPAINEAPSDLILIGRYVLGADMFDMLDTLAPAKGGEILLTDGLLMAATAGNLLGVVSDIDRHDTGTPMGWLQAVIEIALKRKDVGAELSTWLEGRFK